MPLLNPKGLKSREFDKRSILITPHNISFITVPLDVCMRNNLTNLHKRNCGQKAVLLLLPLHVGGLGALICMVKFGMIRRLPIVNGGLKPTPCTT